MPDTAYVIAVDLPSGQDPMGGALDPDGVFADETVTFRRAAVHDVIAGRNPLSPQITGALLDEIRRPPRARDPVAPLLNPDVPTLTERDREVLDLLAQGLTNVEMARELVITEAAVKSRLTQLTGKFGVASRVQLLVRACELGVVQPRLR